MAFGIKCHIIMLCVIACDVCLLLTNSSFSSAGMCL